MKTAIIDPSAFSIPYDHHLCSGLANHGCAVRLISSGELSNWNADSYIYDDFFYPYTDRLFSDGRLRNVSKGVEHIGGMVALARKLRQLNPDIIHFQWLPVAPVDRLLLPMFRSIAPLVLTVHNSTPFHGDSTSAIQLRGVASARQYFDHLIAHTESTKETLQKSGIPDENISVIPHGVIRYPVGETNYERPSDRLRVLFFGTIKPYKGIDVLLKAVAKLPSELQDRAEFLIAGMPQMPVSSLQKQAANLGIEGNVSWDLRRIPHGEVGSLFETADIAVFPYRDIDQSGALMSMLPFGVPVVASSIGGFSEVLTDDVHGSLVEPENPAALSDALASLLANESRRSEMGAAVHELATTTYSWETIAEETAAAYESLL